MMNLRRISISVLAATLTSSAFAQDWKAEWDKTVAAAKQEGALIVDVTSNPSWSRYITERWAKDFPEIKMSVSGLDTSVFIMRIRQERSAGKFLWDASAAGISGPFVMYKEGILDPLPPEFILPEVKDEAVWGGWDQAFYDKPRQYAFAIGAYLKMPFYNAKLVPPEKIASQKLEVLNDKAYAGKVFWHAPWVRGSGRSFAWMLYRELGEEKLTKLIKDQKVVFLDSQNEVVERMARGQVALGIGPAFQGMLEPFRQAGVPMDVRPFGNTPDVAEMAPGGFNLNIYNKRPHPNATRVFVNWLLSKDVIAGLSQSVKLTLRRQDVPSPEAPEFRPIHGLKYSKAQSEENGEGEEKAIAFIEKAIGR
jgi:ABC-type Fe3+ transport system substrate-binding protein